MKQVKTRFLTIIAFTFLTLTSSGQIKEVIKVSSVFSDFCKAVEKKDAVSALKYVDESTIKYFELILNSLKQSDIISNDSSFMTNKLFISFIRENLPNEQYGNLNTIDFFKMTIQNGLIQKLDIQRFHIGRITLNGDIATALLTTYSSDEKTECIFQKEKKNWKIDLSSLIPYLLSASIK